MATNRFQHAGSTCRRYVTAAGRETRIAAGQNRLFNGMSVAVDNTIDPTKPADLQAAQQ